MEKIGYVYLTTNLVNGKQYVGQHLHDGFDKYYKGSGKAIINAFNKYGWDNFSCEVLQWCTTQTQLNEVEDNCIKLYGTMFPNGYNLRGGGANGKFSKEARENCRKGQNKYWANEENRKKQSKVRKKYISSEEGIKSCKKHSEFMKNYFKCEENSKKASEAQKKRFEDPKERKKSTDRFKKYYENEENRKKHSEAHKGKKFSEETRKKQTEALINNPKLSKKVYQYTKDDEFIKEWCSLHEIQRELGFNITGLSACCLEHKKSYKGYKWSYKPSH